MSSLVTFASPIGDVADAGGIPSGVYLHPDGVSLYYQPDGVSLYLQP